MRIHRKIDAPGHGKDIVDGMNSRDKGIWWVKELVVK